MTRDEGIERVAPNSANQADNAQQSDNEGQGQQQAQGEQQDEAGLQEVKDNVPVRKNDPRTSVQKNEEYRYASNIPGDRTVPEQAYADYTLEYDEEDAVMNGKIPDV